MYIAIYSEKYEKDLLEYYDFLTKYDVVSTSSPVAVFVHDLEEFMALVKEFNNINICVKVFVQDDDIFEHKMICLEDD